MHRYTCALILLAIASTLFPTTTSAHGAFAQGTLPDRRRVFGLSYNKDNSGSARQDALARCRQSGATNCSVLATFRNQCYAVAITNISNGVGADPGPDVRSARAAALAECTRYSPGLACHVVLTVCDTIDAVVAERARRAQTTAICIRPIFSQEMKLRSMIDGTANRTREIADAINYLRAEFCRTTGNKMTSDHSTHLGDNCYEYSGLLADERVYWGQCHE